MTTDENVFKRINFFKGFVTTEDDWNHAERYHVDKRKLHNRAFHGVGVVPGWQDEFRVAPRGKGELSAEIFPGYGIDGQGNDVMLWKPTILPLNKGDYKLPQTIYLVVRYVEEHTDFIAYKQNLDFKGHRRIAEMCKLEWTEKEPDYNAEIELCRVALTKDATALEIPKDPLDPGPNTIDRRFVPYAGVAGGFIEASILLQLRMLLKAAREHFGRLWREQQVASAGVVHQALVTMSMLAETGTLRPENVVNIMELIAEMQTDVVGEIEATKPGMSAKSEFKSFKNNVELLRNAVGEGKTALASGTMDSEKLMDVVGFQGKGADAIGKVVSVSAPVRPAAVEAEPSGDAGASLRIILDNDPGWEAVKVRSEPFTETIVVNGVTWTMVDDIDMLDKKSEEEHAFTIRDARDQYRMRQKQRYPDGTHLSDAGIAHEGGYAEWEIHNVTPNVDLVIIRRMDYVRADYECEVYCEGELVGVIPCPGDDRRFRWRNWPFQIPARFITKDRLRIRQVMQTADRDINFFHLWFYQSL
jgi:hypothetical protein